MARQGLAAKSVYVLMLAWWRDASPRERQDSSDLVFRSVYVGMVFCARPCILRLGRASTQCVAPRPSLAYRRSEPRPVRLAVRTPASHVGNRGSIPLRGATKLLILLMFSG